VCSLIRTFHLHSVGAPTFVLLSDRLQGDDFCKTFAELVGEVDSISSTVDLLRRYPCNPWDRVTAEVEEGFARAMRAMDRDREKRGPRVAKRKATQAEIDALLDEILSSRHFLQEAEALRDAWRGSVQLQGDRGDLEPASSGIGYERFFSIFSRIVEMSEEPLPGSRT
jgi:hypothetical protein